MKLIITALSIIFLSNTYAAIIPQLTYSQMNSSMYIENTNSGAGESFASNSSTMMEFNLRYLMSPNWHFSGRYVSNSDQYEHSVAQFSESEVSRIKTGIAAHYYLFRWLELTAKYFSTTDYFATVPTTVDVEYEDDSYSSFDFGLSINVPLRSFLIFIFNYNVSPAAKSSQKYTYGESGYTAKVLYKMRHLMLGISYKSQIRSKESDDFKNIHEDSGIGLEFNFSF